MWIWAFKILISTAKFPPRGSYKLTPLRAMCEGTCWPYPHECLILSHFNTFCQSTRWKKHISPLFQFAFPWSQVIKYLFVFLLAIHSFSSVNYLFLFLPIFLLNCLYYWFLGLIWIAETLTSLSCNVYYKYFLLVYFVPVNRAHFVNVLSCRSFKFQISQIIIFFFL